MSLIMEQIRPENLELFALEFGKIAATDFVYTLASPNINPLTDDKILDRSNLKQSAEGNLIFDENSRKFSK